jgi:Lrp/AsnC family transcriptional regulator, leucine-responsive regulatory protein
MLAWQPRKGFAEFVAIRAGIAQYLLKYRFCDRILPIWQESLDRRHAMPPSDPPDSLDTTDRRILRLLIEDGDLSSNELAARVGLTAAPLSRRLARLTESGVLRRTVIVDPKAVGLGLTVFLEVTLERKVPQVGDRFLDRVTRMPEVLECHAVAGDFDFLLKISVRDVADYKRLLWTAFETIPEIKTLRSMVLLDTAKFQTSTVP